MSVSVGFVSNASGLAVSSSIGILSPSGPGNGADGPKSGKLSNDTGLPTANVGSVRSLSRVFEGLRS